MAETSFPKSSIKVLLLENIHPIAAEAFRADGFAVETLKTALPEAELAAKIRDVHILGIRSKTQITPKVLDEARRLLAIGAFCIGTNQIDLVHSNKVGTPAFNAPFSNTRSVAELIIAEIVMLSRQLGDRVREVHSGKWRKLATGSHEVRGHTLGIVGYGHIGSQIGVLAESFGMRVVFYDVMAKLPMGNNRSVAFDELLATADFVTLHVPETPQTKNMIGAAELARMKPGACLLNASRGTVVVIDALAEALRSGHIGGAAVDVYPAEPESNSDGFESALRGLSNVLLTPHIGGSTEEAQEAIGREVSASLMKFINQGATTGAVNFPQVELPMPSRAHRILNTHRNVPGVLRDINRIVSDLHANIRAQLLSTDSEIGYLIMDLDQDVSQAVNKAVAELPTSIRTRILF
ncbi:MAG TPA: phosphoglycerate dehydrogenase [Kofleriaceae bacterium]|jgi:D-3-phosphoglycerate dehydrogenase|nr:phosphoglycerate dehydrogenase [Kofleriaceae bacterium]